MPRKQDFSQSTIYHIRRIETKDIVYVGSSCNFTQRQSKHKYACCNENDKDYNTPIYVYIREQGGFNLFEVVPVSFHKIDNKIQLRILEQCEIDKYPNAYNKKKAYRTETEIAQRKKEWNEANVDRLKEWREKNKERLAQEHKKWWEANKEKVAPKGKEYREKHKKELTQKAKDRYEANKAEINAKIECPCCKKMTSKKHLSRHQKSTACPSNP